MPTAEEQIRKFQEFIEDHYKAKLLEAASKGRSSLTVDFNDLTKFDPGLAEDLLNSPEDTLKAAELAFRQIDLPEEKKIKLRLANLPESQKVMISEIRSSHIGKLLYVEGLVRKKTDVRPQVVSSRFECPSCGQILLILQLDQSLKEPSKCSCGRKGKFLLVSKELVDAQGLVLEEIPESLEGGEQPKRINVFLKEDLVSPISEKRTNPGSKVKVFGILNEVPVMLRTGGKGTRFELMLEANNVEASEENFYNIAISKEEEQKIIELSQDPRIYEKLIGSIAPSIYGYEKIKEALVLQLLGGVQKKRKDGITTRGDIHVLLVGDPGCIAGDSRVALYYKGMRPIKELGTSHLQKIREIVSEIRRNSGEKPYDFATRFHIYKNQPVVSIKTETGKSVTATYNQPFLTKEGWKRADELAIGEKVRVMPSIPNTIKKLKPTNFTEAPKKSGRLKANVGVPEYFTPELAGLCGYIIGDGNVHPNGYRITCYVNDEENDLIDKLSAHWLSTFNIEPVIITTIPGGERFITSGASGMRQIISTQPLHLLDVNSRQVAMNMSFLKEKAVPQAIFESPKRVVASFLSWLFEADGTVFGNGRGRTAVQLKSKSEQLLKDVQLLLLYFGIQSRIIQDNLCIRRAHDIALFAKYISFQSSKKTGRMAEVISSLELRTEHLRKGLQRYEKVVQIMPAGVIDVFDFEVPKSHSFVANGIVCHNSGKSQLLKRVSTIAPKGRYVSGKGVSGAGITAAVVRDELLGGWSLEAGALVLANNGVCAIDELDKMADDDRDALHESMEQQTLSISKANIQATLLTRTTVLSAANPKHGRFDPYGILSEQLDLPPTLINRFDLIFPVKDIPEPAKDEKMARHILALHQAPDILEMEIPTTLLKKYFAYARQRTGPVLTDGALNEIKDFYVQMRGLGATDERIIKAIPISARQLEALVRMAEASARVRLSEKVTRRDARRAIDLLTYCLVQVGLDRETGRIDIDRISTGIPASQRDRIYAIKSIITELEGKIGKAIPIDDIIKMALDKGISEHDAEEVVQRLKISGDIYEPRSGFVSRM